MPKIYTTFAPRGEPTHIQQRLELSHSLPTPILSDLAMFFYAEISIKHLAYANFSPHAVAFSI